MKKSSQAAALPPTYVLADIHGDVERLIELLHSVHLIEKGTPTPSPKDFRALPGFALINGWHWHGERRRLVALGDLIDRGPYGLVTALFLYRLSEEAATEGGQVIVLTGNHDLLLTTSAHALAEAYAGRGLLRRKSYAYKLRAESLARRRQWWGGLPEEVEWLAQPEGAFLLNWLESLPLLFLDEGGNLFQHSDTHLYLEYGQSVDEINQRAGTIIKESFNNHNFKQPSNETPAWLEESGDDPFNARQNLINMLNNRHSFDDSYTGAETLTSYRETLQAEVIHYGHTIVRALIGTGAVSRQHEGHLVAHHTAICREEAVSLLPDGADIRKRGSITRVD